MVVDGEWKQIGHDEKQTEPVLSPAQQARAPVSDCLLRRQCCHELIDMISLSHLPRDPPPAVRGGWVTLSSPLLVTSLSQHSSTGSCKVSV